MLVHRRGHNFKSVGSRHYMVEEVECEKINQSINKYLDLLGIKHINASPGNLPTSKDLEFGVNIANKNNTELYFSIHMNSSKTPTLQPKGCEIWTYKDDLPQAKKVLQGLEKLGFINRGIKHSQGLYELRKTHCKAMIIEICFVNSKEDTDLYNSIGADEIARVIVEGITGRTIPKQPKICPLCGHNL